MAPQNLQHLLAHRRMIKRRKPTFIRQDAHKKGKLDALWRKPKGLQSKMRKHLRGYRRSPSSGFRSPQLVRGLDKRGLLPLVVHNKADLQRLDPQKNSVILGSTLGNRKKLEVLQYALEKRFNVLNVKDAKKTIADINESLKKRVEAKKKAREEKKKKSDLKKRSEEKKEEKKEGIDQMLSEEEKKKQEKKEFDKLVTQKQ